MAAIETSDLTKSYGDVVAVDGVDLTVEEGEVYGFLGPNGAGKSTVINMLMDYTPPSGGSATILGHDTRGDTIAIRERVGVLPDAYSLYERLSGRRHLEFVIEAREAPDEPEDVLDRVGLDPDDAERPAGDYSKGMAQRLVLGMALVGNPDLLILDEPSTGLDPNGIRMMRNIIREEVDRGAAVFFSSHILAQVRAVCDRVGIMNEGRLIEVATLEELSEAAAGESTMSVTVDQVQDAPLLDIEGVDDVEAAGSTIQVTLRDAAAKARVIDTIENAGMTALDIEMSDSSLEDLFASLTDTDSSSEVEA